MKSSTTNNTNNLHKADNSHTVALERAQRIAHTIAPNVKQPDVFVIANRTMFAVRINPQTGALEVVEPGAGGLVTATSKVPMARVIGWPGENFGDSNEKVRQEVAQLLDKVNTTPVHLTAAEYQGHYLNFANQILWLLFHADSPSLARALQEKAGWVAGKDDKAIADFAQRYHALNVKTRDFKTVWQLRSQVLQDSFISRVVMNRFIDTMINELKRSPLEPIMWIHDYQLIFLCHMFRKRVEQHPVLHKRYVPIGFFCHIPFPKPAEFQKAVAGGLSEQDLKEILVGPLGADQIGFHISQYCENYINTLIEFNDKLKLGITNINQEEGWVEYQNRKVSVKAFPIGIDYATYTSPEEARSRNMVPEKVNLNNAQKKQIQDFELFHQDTKVILSVERLDPIKGIVEKLRAFESLLMQHPELIDKVSYECIVVPSRSGARINDELDVEIKEIVQQINKQFKTVKFPNGPINFVNESRETPVLCEYYRRSHVMNTASSSDGMNLTAMEYVAARYPGTGGALVLSPLMGVTEHFCDHQGKSHFFIVDPDGKKEHYAQELYMALNSCDTSKGQRDIDNLKEIVVEHCNVHVWAKNYLHETAQRAQYNKEKLQGLSASAPPATVLPVGQHEPLQTHLKAENAGVKKVMLTTPFIASSDVSSAESQLSPRRSAL